MVTGLARTVALGSAGNFWAARGDSDRAGHLGQAFVVGRGFRRAAVGKPALGHDSPDFVHNRGHDLRGGPLTGPYLGAVSSTVGRPHYHNLQALESAANLDRSASAMHRSKADRLMSAMGHLRPRQSELDRAACPLCPETGQVHHRKTSAECPRNRVMVSLRSTPSRIKEPHKYRARRANHNPSKAEVVSSNLAGRAKFQMT